MSEDADDYGPAETTEKKRERIVRLLRRMADAAEQMPAEEFEAVVAAVARALQQPARDLGVIRYRKWRDVQDKGRSRDDGGGWCGTEMPDDD